MVCFIMVEVFLGTLPTPVIYKFNESKWNEIKVSRNRDQGHLQMHRPVHDSLLEVVYLMIFFPFIFVVLK